MGNGLSMKTLWPPPLPNGADRRTEELPETQVDDPEDEEEEEESTHGSVVTADCATQTNGRVVQRPSVASTEEEEEELEDEVVVASNPEQDRYSVNVTPKRQPGLTCVSHRSAAWRELDPALLRDFLAEGEVVVGGAPRQQCSLDRALAIVANKWERERRRQLQEAARRDTILRQRKMSAVIKVRGQRALNNLLYTYNSIAIVLAIEKSCVGGRMRLNTSSSSRYGGEDTRQTATGNTSSPTMSKFF